MVIPPGYVAWSLPMRHDLVPRPSFITGGVKKETATNDPTVLADLIGAQFYAAGSLVTNLDNTVLLGPMRVSIGQDGGPPIVGEGVNTARGGTSRSTPPPNVAVLVKKRTALGGRTNRGRFYIPWYVNETSIDEAGQLDSGSKAEIQTAMNALRGNLAVAGVPMVVLHSTDPAVPAVVIALTLDPLVATQRRRLGR